MKPAITIRGARTHNLKSIDLDLPRDQFVVITGISGSGKSSLAFDTLYAEGQRRYVESLSAYARQFIARMPKPDCDAIEGLSPAISIDQKTRSHNPRSTVGTVTEVHDYLRLLFARIGHPHCPDHGQPLGGGTTEAFARRVLSTCDGIRCHILAPVLANQTGEHVALIKKLIADGFTRGRVDGIMVMLEDIQTLDRTKRHSIDVVVDRLVLKPDHEQRLRESVDTAVRYGGGDALITVEGQSEMWYSAKSSCRECGFSMPPLEPRMFSFNSPSGACQECDGIGERLAASEAALVVDESMSLEEGAFRGWTPSYRWNYQVLAAAAKHHQVPLDEPLDTLSTEQRHLIMRGDGSEQKIAFSYRTATGRIYRLKRPWRGVLGTIERQYKEASAHALRELAMFMSPHPCEGCSGGRLNSPSSHVIVLDTTLPKLTKMTVARAHEWFETAVFSGAELDIATPILRELRQRLNFMLEVGLGYLTLDRTAHTLSGGEAQRIRLAGQIGSGLVGCMYVLDEPSIGLHQRDNSRLIRTMRRLTDLGNTVLVVEHDADTMRAADHVVDIGPGAGKNGGEICATGTATALENNPNSLTGAFLSGREEIKRGIPRDMTNTEHWMELTGACGNNLQRVDLRIPQARFVCVTGVSGSGKSSLINATLLPALMSRAGRHGRIPLPYTALRGVESIRHMYEINQSPIGRTPRSNPATYTGLFTPIRDLFAQVPEARVRGYKPGRFSFNVSGGRCEACSGDGLIKVEMHFLPDLYVTCDECRGRRYNSATLDVKYHSLSIADVLDLTVDEALEVFTHVPSVANRLRTLSEVGLGYITLGQSATTLSGGEAQRIKLATELSRQSTVDSLFILDEPTTGLHFHDVRLLIGVIQRLVERGNTVVTIEHNLDVIKCADWVIDLGPEGGAGGGHIVAEGTPHHITQCDKSHTGRFLKEYL